MTRIETVLIIYQPPKILLGMKKTKFGKGKYNGFGGGIKENETLEEAAIRETIEEAGIKVKNVEKMGEILFKFQTDEQDHDVHFFKATEYEGELKETDEMTPKWFHVDEIPYGEMWPDDQHWMPLFLKGKKFKGNFDFNEEHQISNYELNEIDFLK